MVAALVLVLVLGMLGYGGCLPQVGAVHTLGPLPLPQQQWRRYRQLPCMARALYCLRAMWGDAAKDAAALGGVRRLTRRA